MGYRLFQDTSDGGKACSRKPCTRLWAPECVWFVFSDFLQLELDKVKDEWNMHIMRQSRHNTVSGRGFEDCGFEVSADDIESILNQKIAGKRLTLADCWSKQHVTKHIFRF